MRPCERAEGPTGGVKPINSPEDSGGSGMAKAGVCCVSAQASVLPEPPGPRLGSPRGLRPGTPFPVERDRSPGRRRVSGLRGQLRAVTMA